MHLEATMEYDRTADEVPNLDLVRATLIYDRARQQPLLRLSGVVVLPVGATVDLPAFAQPATVVGVRLLATAGPAGGGGGSSACVCLDVELATAGAEDEAAQAAAVPAPIAAAIADLDLDPDAAKPLGTPLSHTTAPDS
jgi:hypothetical protein